MQLGAIVVDRWKDFAISFTCLTFVASRELVATSKILLRRALSTWKALVDAVNGDADECDEHNNILDSKIYCNGFESV